MRFSLALVLVGACVPSNTYRDEGGDAGDAAVIDATAEDAPLVVTDAGDAGDAGDVAPAVPEPSVTLAANNAGTCVVEGGQVTCWGQNHNKMLGTTRPGYDWQPPTKLALSGIDDIALGYRHACAVVRRPARVRCWGAVPGGTGESEVPQDVALPEALANAGIDYVSLGRAHSCLLSLKATPSRVWCWGRNERGQVGAGGSVSPQPLPVEGLTDATRLSAGDDHTCVVLERGSIKCWGRSDFYQAGSTSRNDAGNVTVPTEIAAPPGDHFVEVRAGDTAEAYPAYPGYTCARTEQRKIYCWGSDAGGRLAQGGALPQPDCDRDAGGLPDATGHEARGACKVPVVVTGIVDAEELRAGGGHACLRRGGSVLCWGHNGGGQLGTGIRSDAVETPAPVKGPDGGQFAAGGPMELGTFHTCTRNGTEVWCWGIGRFDGPDASPLNDSPIRMKLP